MLWDVVLGVGLCEWFWCGDKGMMLCEGVVLGTGRDGGGGGGRMGAMAVTTELGGGFLSGECANSKPWGFGRLALGWELEFVGVAVMV